MWIKKEQLENLKQSQYNRGYLDAKIEFLTKEINLRVEFLTKHIELIKKILDHQPPVYGR